MSASTDVALSMQELAAIIDAYLENKTGQRTHFVLMVSADNVTQYASNCSRPDGVALIESLLARWQANRADIPAHYNPDLKKH